MRRSSWKLAGLLGIALCLGADAPVEKGKWTPISDSLVTKLAAEAKDGKIPWPGNTGGITADPATGDVFMVVCGEGVYKSSDHGKTFARSDDKHVGGRCETGAALQWDTKGKRLACFMLDGNAGMTLDGGKTWTSFADVGRNWDYGAVDWSAEKPVDILAMKHESDGELYLSSDAGQHWNKIAKDKDFDSVGIFDGKTLLTSKKAGGIFRSVDDGATWTQTADLHVTSHVVQIYNGAAYLVAKEGLIVSTDKGNTWTRRGDPVEATFGPRFKDAKNIIVWGKKGILESTDSGATWKLAASIPGDLKNWAPEHFLNVGWDTKANIFYGSRMGQPAFRLEQ